MLHLRRVTSYFSSCHVTCCVFIMSTVNNFNANCNFPAIFLQSHNIHLNPQYPSNAPPQYICSEDMIQHWTQMQMQLQMKNQFWEDVQEARREH